MGASAQDILRMVIAHGMRSVLLGLGLGLGGSLVLIKLIGSSVFGFTTTATDLRIYLLVALLLGVVALIACYLPAWRATRIDPATALRAE
jgi:putative ABC transport system permease protein